MSRKRGGLSVHKGIFSTSRYKINGFYHCFKKFWTYFEKAVS